MSLMMLIWIADSVAYFSGRRWGNRRLAPCAEPGKDLGRRLWCLIGALLWGVLLVALLPLSRGGGCCCCCSAHDRGAVGCRRPVRESAQAPARAQGRRFDLAGTRRRARSYRQHDRRRAVVRARLIWLEKGL
jgi:hypothetical protein